jgi:hypothetical protein
MYNEMLKEQEMQMVKEKKGEENNMYYNYGGSMRKSVKKLNSPVKTGMTHKCKDGVERKLYKKGVDMYVKMKSKKTGKMIYKKVKV